MAGVWVAGSLSGVLLLLIGVLRLGRFIAFIPAPVVTGFTSGIALIIAIGQIDNLIGVKTPGAESVALKLLGYLEGGLTPNLYAIAVGSLVMLMMLFWPASWNSRFPASLLGIIVATFLAVILSWPVNTIGEIPQTLILSERLEFSVIPWENLQEFLLPTLTIAALGAVESLLCGAVASNMTGIRLQANQELIGQGIGNILLPFFGGVPATAAIARTSVGIKSGGKTRLVSIIHSIALLASMFLLAPIMSRIPLAALAGVLIVTAWRMNDWEDIHYIFKYRFRTAMITFTVTMIATVTLDLTQAIAIGAFLSGAVFLSQIANLNVDLQDVDPEKLRRRGIENAGKCGHVQIAYITGPLFFAATGHFNEAFTNLKNTHALVLSMRGTPLIDTSGLQVLAQLHEKLHQENTTLMLTSLHPQVRHMLVRGGMMDVIGEKNIFWSADEAIIAAEKKDCIYCQMEKSAEKSPFI
jgi:SulP family sulfate permease